MERGVVPWTKPWKTDKSVGIMPANAITGRAYSGINVPILWDSTDRNGYPSHQWLTYKQAQAAGGNVKKGEKSTHVVFTKPLVYKDEADEERRASMLREYNVFNVQQIDGLEIKEPAPKPEPERHAVVDAFIAATGADIRLGGDRACFVPSKDFIILPHASAFKGIEHFYATSLHECGHWAGAEKRLNRNLTGRFGTKAYAAEELIAELTAAFLCAHLGIKGELRHADYIANWLELLRSDDRAIFTAASKASQAANHLRSYSECSDDQGEQ